MKYLMIAILCIASFFGYAQETISLTKVMMRGSTKAEADKLFSLYTDDFVYVHAVYGGTYSKEHLYNNTVKYIGGSAYSRETNRYKIISMIPGFNAVAVEQLEMDDNVKHLAVFEFKGSKISKIIEYWQ